MVKRWLLIFLLISAGTALAQDNDGCDTVDTPVMTAEAEATADASAAPENCAEAALTLGETGIPYNSWVVVDAPEESALLEDAAERYNVDGTCFYGFLYIDHTVGVTLNLESFCELSAGGDLIPTSGPRTDDSVLLLRYDDADGFARFDLTLMSETQREALELPEQPDWLDMYLNDDVTATRAIRSIDPLRFPSFPDDIQVLLIPQSRDDDIEQVWCRLERQLAENMVECELLNEPYQDFGVRVGNRLIIELTEVEGQWYAVVAGIAEAD